MNAPARVALTLLIVVATVVATGCSRSAPERYVPGLGEIMSAQQKRHIKLWFAGEAGNWPLASYELDELREGFDDAVRLHPTHDGIAISKLVPEITSAPLKRLDEVVAGKDGTDFEAAFDGLTAACNACHEAAHFGFNVITRPRSNPYSNQVFEADSAR